MIISEFMSTFSDLFKSRMTKSSHSRRKMLTKSCLSRSSAATCTVLYSDGVTLVFYSVSLELISKLSGAKALLLSSIMVYFLSMFLFWSSGITLS